MVRAGHTAEQVIGKLRRRTCCCPRGRRCPWGVAEQVYYEWRVVYDGITVDRVRQLKD